MHWLAVSILLSIVLTVVLNVALRLFPGAGERVDRKDARLAERHPDGGVVVPWKAMIAVSLVLTIALNLVLWARR